MVAGLRIPPEIDFISLGTRNLRLPPRLDLIFNLVILPSTHCMSVISKPPLSRIPFIEPALQASGNACLLYTSAKYAGYRIKEAQMELEDSGIQYKITILNGKLKKRLLFDANWMFIGEKL